MARPDPRPRIVELRTVRHVVDAHEEHWTRYGPWELGASWNTLGKIVRQQREKHVLRGAPAMLEPLAEDTEQALPWFEARPLANTVSGLANLHASRSWRASDALWAGLATQGITCVSEMEAQHLSNTLHGFAKVGRREPALLDAIATEAARRDLRQFVPQALANTAWAYATAGHAAPALLDAIAKEAVRRGLREFNPQDLSNTAWAYATAGHAAPALLDAIAEEAVRRGLRDFNEQNLANTAWAYGTAGHAAPALLDAIAEEAVRRGLREFNPQNLTNMAWAYATAGHATPALLNAIAKEAARRGLREFNPQDLSNMAWANATAGHAAPALLNAIAKEAARRGLHKFNQQHLAITAWAYAKAGHAAAALLDAIDKEAARRGLRDFKPQELANLAWAYATAGHAAQALLDAIAKEAVRRGLRDFKPQHLANMAWAYAVANHPAPALFGGDAFVQRCAAEIGFGAAALSQLHQWQLWQEERGAAWPPLPPELAQRCRDAFCQAEGVPSGLQREVTASLRALGLAPLEEERTPQGYSLDVMVSHGGREVAVEVDGPWHFFGRRLTGATALKRRQLRAAGWALLPVPYWEWDALGSKAAKEEYLQRALEGLGHTLQAGSSFARAASSSLRADARPFPAEAPCSARDSVLRAGL